jgi:sigma-B regulation protein RsbU (phosphoserine phosphatase)
MTLRAIFERKPDMFDRLGAYWRELTGGQLLAVDQDGDWVAGGHPFTHSANGVLPENWREWLGPQYTGGETLVVEGQPVQIAPLDFQDTALGYLVAVGQAPPEIFRWSVETLKALIAAEVSLHSMTDELISAWDQLELVYRVTQSLASNADLESVLRSVLAEVQRVLQPQESFLILEHQDTLIHVSVGGDEGSSPEQRQLYYGLQRAGRMVLCNDSDALHEFWPDAPSDLINLLGTRLPLTTSAEAAIGLINKGEPSFTAGDAKLLTAVAEQIAAIINNTLLHQQVLEQERMQRELEIAAEIQVSLLPQGLPEIPGVDFAVASLPATEVGGDFYDFVALNENYLGILMGDVAGKGVPAAMLTALARTILRVEAGYGHPPQRVIKHTNRALIRDLQHAEMFITAFVAYLNPDDLTLTYASAGHTPALWWHGDQGTFELLTATTPPLGIQIAEAGGERTVQLLPGDFILFYTDGVTETMSPENQPFGTDRLKEALIAHIGSTANDLMQSVLIAVRAFRRSAPWSDDLTMIAMRLKPSAAPKYVQPHPVVEFVVPADLHALDTISHKVTQVCRSLPGLPPPPASDDFVYLVELAVSEICTNIIEHAYHMMSGEIRGSLTPLDNGIQIDLYDDGESFDPSVIPEPSPEPDEITEGGYGLHIVRQIMDVMLYQANTPKGNHWRLIKYIS